MSKLWFNLYDNKDYDGSEPAFYKPNDLEFAKIFENNYLIIKQELDVYLEKNNLQSYFNSSMVEKQGSWKTVALKAWDVNIYENFNFFPKTTAIINSVDGLVSASFNMLEPNAKIKSHYGDTNGIFRCHLGLQIPATIPNCGFRVKDEWASWEEGKLLVFVDANNHEAINLTNKSRFIFLFDIVRPEFRKQKNYICSTVITSLFFQKIAEKINVLHKTPFMVQVILAKTLLPLVNIAIPIRNFLYQYKK